MMLDDRVLHIFGTELWDRMNEKERRRVRHHLQASTISQFMHGEQSALIATAKIVQTVPELDIQPHRPDCEGHRSLGAPGAGSLRGDGRNRICSCRCRRSIRTRTPVSPKTSMPECSCATQAGNSAAKHVSRGTKCLKATV